LHFVIASEDQPEIMKFASKIDNYILQESLIEEMNKGLKTKIDEFTNEK
jgi:hypothetical protein